MDNLKNKVRSLPLDPGCYLMKNSRGQIIYVGKAKELKKRVSSYFSGSSNHSMKTKKLVKEIVDFDIIITETEVEALLLERTLIRDHQPRYNILLRDDREYPWVRVDFREKWPRIEKVRRRLKDGAHYIGPYGSEAQLNNMLGMIGKVFPIIRCSRYELEHTKRPCNYYEMSMCLAPCSLDLDKNDYTQMIRRALKVLSGKTYHLAQDLKTAMADAASKQRYEKAAELRDQLKALEGFQNKQSVIIKNITDADVIGIASRDSSIAFHVMFIRDGKLSGSDGFIVKTHGHTEEEALSDFLIQYYEGHSVPATIILPRTLPDSDIFQTALTSKSDTSVNIHFPRIGQKRDLISMAFKNAQYQLDEHSRSKGKKKVELELIKSSLNLSSTPNRMECIDISNIQSTAIVASNVCFIDGKPAKDQYRVYDIESTDGKQDDFQSIYEVVERRLRRAKELDDCPDLLVIDGGKGQLSKAMEAKSLYPNLSFDLVSIAKSRNKSSFNSEPTRTSERLFFPNKPSPFLLKEGSPEFRLFTSIRDEAHRFAISHHRKKRDKISRSSLLKEIPGVGPTLEKRLLETFKGLRGIKKARLHELESIEGVSKALAHKIYISFQDD